jgi:hypothetical protein
MLSLDSHASQFGLFVHFLQTALLAADSLRASLAQRLGTEQCILGRRYSFFLWDWRSGLEDSWLWKVFRVDSLDNEIKLAHWYIPLYK